MVKQDSGLRAFEIKWSPRRTSGRAFRDAYDVEVESSGPDNPFATERHAVQSGRRRTG